MDETITSFADRLIELAEKVIRESGGERTYRKGRPVYQIATETPLNVHPLRPVENQGTELRAKLAKEVRASVVEGASLQQRARGAYLAICLGLAPALAEERPAEWRKAVAALNSFEPLVSYLLSDQPGTATHTQLKERAASAGLVSRK